MNEIVHFVEEIPADGRIREPLWKEQLRERPGVWAELTVAVSSLPRMRTRSKGFEFVARGGKAYGRYIGETEK